MSTRHDRNYLSFDGAQENVSGRSVDPLKNPLFPAGSWQDTVKFAGRINCRFADFTILRGGTEDAVDVTASEGCSFDQFTVVPGDRYVLTLKGESHRNWFDRWSVLIPAPVVDIEIGAWHSYNTGPSTQNHFSRWTSWDGRPITYCYRWGCKPTFSLMTVRHLWWRSAMITAHWAAKYFWHVTLGRADK